MEFPIQDHRAPLCWYVVSVCWSKACSLLLSNRSPQSLNEFRPVRRWLIDRGDDALQQLLHSQLLFLLLLCFPSLHTGKHCLEYCRERREHLPLELILHQAHEVKPRTQLQCSWPLSVRLQGLSLRLQRPFLRYVWPCQLQELFVLPENPKDVVGISLFLPPDSSIRVAGCTV